jgi:DNA-directed RNA polymerase specialized sigma24 family protein
MKYEEIATVLECEPGTVKVRVFRAMRALEQAYRTLADERGSLKDRDVANGN